MLDQFRADAVGSTAVMSHVPGDVADIGRRLVEGDATMGWRGDPTMQIHFALPVDLAGRPLPGGVGVFEVWALDARREPYLVLTADRCDAEILRRVARAANRDPVADAVKDRARREARKEAEFREHVGAYGDKLHFALTQDVGQHYGGLTRRQFPMSKGAPTERRRVRKKKKKGRR